jgi:hypothetical protein
MKIPIITRCVYYPWIELKHVCRKYGWHKTFFPPRAIGLDGKPHPWFSYPCVEWIKAQDWSNRTVQEFGGGYGSLWWAEHAKRLDVYESNAEWAGTLNYKLAAAGHSVEKAQVLFASYKQLYVRAIPGTDLYIVDGSWRDDCARIVASTAKPGAHCIVDNVNHYPEAAAPLRNSSWLEMEFTGPCAGWVGLNSTSVFMRRTQR